MLAVAIDSSQDIGTIALGTEEGLVCEYHFASKMSLLKRLAPNIETVLSDSGSSIDDVDAVFVSLGPGSFTGLRIGITTAKSLAYALSVPLVGICTLDALAKGIAPTPADLICPMIHARADEAYWSIFDSYADLRLEEYGVSNLSEILDRVDNHGGAPHFVGTGALKNHEAIRHRFGSRATIAGDWASFARGATLLNIGFKRFHDGNTDDPMTLTPMYIRKPTPVVKMETGEFEKSQ